MSLCSKHVIALGGLMILSAILAGWSIGHESYWDDEAYSVLASELAPWRIAELTVTGDPQTGLWHLLLSLWSLPHQLSETYGRWLALLIGVASIPTFWLLVRRMFDTTTAYVAATMLVFNGSFVTYERELRMYTLVFFLMTLSTLLLMRSINSKSWKPWVLWGIVSGVGVYAHPFVLLALVGQLTSFLFLPSTFRPWKLLAAAFGGFVIVAAPFVAAVTTNVGNPNWLPDVSIYLVKISGFFLAGTDNAIYFVVLLVPIGAFLVLAIRSLRESVRSEQSWLFVMLVLWIVSAPVIAIAFSFVKPVLWPRYLMPSLPAYLAIVAAGVTFLWRLLPERRHLLLPVVAPLLLGFMYFGSTENAYAHKADWRSAMEIVDQQSVSSDAIVHARHLPVVSYYVDKDSQSPTPIYAPDQDFPQTSDQRYAVLTNIKPPPRPSEGELAALLEQHPRLWVVDLESARSNGTDRVVQSLPTGYERVMAQRVDSSVFVELWSRVG